jgi:hypothetical protein
MTRYHKVNNIKVPFTAEEEAARDAEEAQAVIDKQARIDAETAEAVKKASGKAKLKELGLDDDEIKALTGA